MELELQKIFVQDLQEINAQVLKKNYAFLHKAITEDLKIIYGFPIVRTEGFYIITPKEEKFYKVIECPVPQTTGYDKTKKPIFIGDHLEHDNGNTYIVETNDVHARNIDDYKDYISIRFNQVRIIGGGYFDIPF